MKTILVGAAAFGCVTGPSGAGENGNPSLAVLDLAQPVPTGEAHQTYLRAVLLVADHTAYHLGQLVAVRRALGAWT